MTFDLHNFQLAATEGLSSLLFHSQLSFHEPTLGELFILTCNFGHSQCLLELLDFSDIGEKVWKQALWAADQRSPCTLARPYTQSYQQPESNSELL